MRGVIGTTFVALMVLSLAGGSAALAEQEQVDLCHFPPGNPDNVEVLSVGEKAAAAHFARHGDWPVFGFNVNEVGCAFCAEDSPDCEIACVGTPPCLCPPDDAACCEANPCCDPCPEPKPEECSLIFCFSDPPECSATVCSG